MTIKVSDWSSRYPHAHGVSAAVAGLYSIVVYKKIPTASSDNIRYRFPHGGTKKIRKTENTRK